MIVKGFRISIVELNENGDAKTQPKELATVILEEPIEVDEKTAILLTQLN